MSFASKLKALARANGTLGTVSQTGGVPTGAMFESGTSGGTRYVKLADGTLIQRKQIEVTKDTISRFAATWTFAVPFSANTYTVSATLAGPDAGGTAANDTTVDVRFLGAPKIWTKTTTTVLAYVYTMFGATDIADGEKVYVDMVAVGRWF